MAPDTTSGANKAGSKAPGSKTSADLVPVTVRSSGGAELEGRLVRAESAENRVVHSVLFLHGFPSGVVHAEMTGLDMPQLCQRVQQELRWNAMSVRLRGCGTSTGDFSLARWVDDATAAIRFLHAETQPDTLWICGFGTGGSVGLVAAVDVPEVTGAVLAGAPADFDDWAASPDRLLRHAREVGVISSADYPVDQERWEAELREVRAVEAAEAFRPRRLLVLHGSDDEVVPHFDARAIDDAHGASDLRFIQGGGHQLRHDPRAISVLLGWLDRQSQAALKKAG